VLDSDWWTAFSWFPGWQGTVTRVDNFEPN